MSTLQVALAVAGGLVLAGVVAHSAWQARKAGIRKPAPAARPVEPEEPRFEEPTLDAGAPESLPPVHRIEPVLHRRTGQRLDPLIDAMATLGVDTLVTGDNALAHFPPTRRAGSKPFMIEGRSEASGEWEPPQPGHLYREFQAGVQLANRTGALNEIEYSEFVHKVQAFAESIGASTDFPDMIEVVNHARELDQFAGEHDAQLACRLLARGSSWSVAYILQHAARHGFVPGVVSGRLVLPSHEEGAPPVLTLQYDPQAAFAEDPSRAAVRDVTVSFDVPQTGASEAPFKAWQASSQALAIGMDAAIVDDNGRPLSPEAFQAIGQELDRLYVSLEARGLAAGSSAARRLFS